MSGSDLIRRLPGMGTERTATPRRVLLSAPQESLFMPRGRVIDGSQSRDPLHTGDLDVLRAGMLMGKRTANSLYAPSILGVTTAAYDASASVNTQLTVGAATAVELNRRIGASGTCKLTGPPTAAGVVATQTVTYSAVNVTTGVITITALSADAISGSFLQPNDGSETPVCLIPDTAGVKVTDEDSTDVDVPFPTPLVGGVVDASQILNWPSNAVLREWIKDTLRDRINVILDFEF